jgi:nitroimidazol reductase NimA-like FMN-containing flavoprotein (pyridoxamine 5'-phosphate oxidase superfamily)
MPAPTRITRLAERASYDRATLDAILDAAYVAHVGVVVDGAPAVIPMACARVGDEQVVAIPLTTFSAKIRTGGPKDAPEDHLPGVWGGVIPLALAKGVPEADATTAPGVAAPRLTA